MCHEIPIGDRLTLDPVTLPLAELLLTKLQIVKLNEKDLRDIIAILHHHAVGEQDGETINAARIARLCAEDWGLWRTCKMNVERVREGIAHYDIASAERLQVEERLERIWESIERAEVAWLAVARPCRRSQAVVRRSGGGRGLSIVPYGYWSVGAGDPTLNGEHLKPRPVDS